MIHWSKSHGFHDIRTLLIIQNINYFQKSQAVTKSELLGEVAPSVDVLQRSAMVAYAMPLPFDTDDSFRRLQVDVTEKASEEKKAAACYDQTSQIPQGEKSRTSVLMLRGPPTTSTPPHGGLRPA